MKTKYKLIQTYPGSPKLNTVQYAHEIRWNPENYPEHWEKVKPEYKIISFVDKNTNHKHTPKSLNMTMEECLNDKDLSIYSVYRTSDNTVICIGDKIIVDKLIKICEDTICFVQSIFLSKLNDYIIIKSNNTIINFKLNSVKLERKPLFTTEDKVDIFEGDLIFIVNISYNYNISEFKAVESHPWCHSNPSNVIKRYKSRKEAINFVTVNKPVLSYNDIMEIAEPYVRKSGNKFQPKKLLLSVKTLKFKKAKLMNLLKSKIIN